jgi:hypothetical protein
MSLNRLNTKSANVLENPLKKIYYYEITKLIGMRKNANEDCKLIIAKKVFYTVWTVSRGLTNEIIFSLVRQIRPKRANYENMKEVQKIITRPYPRN